MLTVQIKGQLGDFSLDADIEAGTGVTALYGPSGAGKSSILRAIAGLWNPTEGRIVLNEEVLFDAERRINLPPRKRNFGVVFQDPLLFPHMNVAENLRYGITKNQWKNNLDWDRVVDMLDLGDLLVRRPFNLSGGEAQRVAIGRAALSNPKMLLLDEPLTGLDERRREQVLPYLETLRDEATMPVVYVSHHRDEIIRLADLVFRVDEGWVREEMTPREFEKATEVRMIVR